MAKETKQDRIVRGILDQVTEHLHELRSLEANPNCKESDVERWVQGFLKNCLGYMSSSGYSIRAQESKGKHRPDLIVLKGDKPIILVEVKKLTFNFNKSDYRSGKLQIAEYAAAFGQVKWGILTNGIEWKLFDFSPGGSGIEIASFELKENDQILDVNKRVVEALCYELLDFHESAYATDSWVDLSKEATVFSPEVLARAILSNDVMKSISKTIRGEYEYKANYEMLIERIHVLLECGLDDSVAGWNESKAIELLKFVKSQKRANRKVRRAKAAEEPAVTAGPEQIAEVSEIVKDEKAS